MIHSVPIRTTNIDLKTALNLLWDRCSNKYKICRPSWTKTKFICLNDFCTSIYCASDERGFTFDIYDIQANDYMMVPFETKYEQKLLTYDENT